MSEDLTRVDSAVAGVHEEHHKEAHHYHRRGSAGNENVRSIKDLSTLSIVISSPHSSPLHSLTSICLSPPTEEEDVELAVAPETQKLNWKFNTPASAVEDKDMLKKYLVTPPVKKIDLIFPLGTKVTARNLHGVTIKDALDAMYKLNKKKADDELDLPYLKGFEWNKKENYEVLFIHQQKEGTQQHHDGSSKKSKKKHASA
ncbi:hypothetical protein AAP_00857 [Ascosphaera apis ARSEF 7405]|uniref:Uncharacterized protein n=1 Tax=Ascosphaera apis ARSEF 7405 TaxID=392613 RepID=A0A168CZY1_9EURO|nr:hypothetical protein AAP_00857 [Ascosphaera apis ARSEF 7405]